MAWGIVMTCTGVTQSFGGLVACRFFLGVTEAGFFPGAIYIVTSWYSPHEVGARIALFFTSSALAGAFSGLLAYAIAKMDGVAGYQGWRWIFLLEGIASVVVGVACFFILIDSPETSSWLTDEEKQYLRLRQISEYGGHEVHSRSSKFSWKILRSCLLDWKLYLQAIVTWSNVVPNYGLKFTMPQIMKNMGYTSSNAQLLTVPPYIVGAISAYVSCLMSDRYKRRMPFIVAAQLCIVTAYGILYSFAGTIQDHIPACYLAICIACFGFYPINPACNAWTANNLAGPVKRAMGVAFFVGLGNVGGIIGSFIFIEKEKPRYPTGFGSSLGFAVAGIIACLILSFSLWRINKRDAQISEAEIRERYTPEELADMGDKSPLYKYTL